MRDSSFRSLSRQLLVFLWPAPSGPFPPTSRAETLARISVDYSLVWLRYAVDATTTRGKFS